MARLIDADALKERATRVSTVKEHCYMKAVGTREIDKAPTIDAVEVIRCEDCKHYNDYFIQCDCPNGLPRIKEDSFCCHGERKDDEL